MENDTEIDTNDDGLLDGKNCETTWNNKELDVESINCNQ